MVNKEKERRDRYDKEDDVVEEHHNFEQNQKPDITSRSEEDKELTEEAAVDIVLSDKNTEKPGVVFVLETFLEVAKVGQRKKRRRRHRKEQNLYMQLSEAMECIEHICTQGCTLVGPTNVVDNNNMSTINAEKSKPCKAFSTCYGLQLLIRHFAVCKKRSNDKGCLRCNRMLQLFRLHSSTCDQPESCRVPLCRQFRKRGEQDKKMGEDTKWKLLVSKVMSAKAMTSLCQSKKNKFEGEAECFNQKIRKGA